MGKLEEAQILWNAIGTETEPDANSTNRVRNAATKIIEFISELANLVSTKVDKVTGKSLSTNDYTNEEKAEVAKVAEKVDKVAGKGLSDNNFSNEEKQKLSELNMNTELTDLVAFKNQFLITESGELILDINNNIIVTV